MKLSISEMEKLVAQFVDSVIRQHDVMFGDPVRGNQYADSGTTAVERLMAFGNAGRDALVPLLQHSRPDVRIAAAAYLLRYKTEEAMAVLRAESTGKGFVSFEASECIKRWEEGDWHLDSEE